MQRAGWGEGRGAGGDSTPPPPYSQVHATGGDLAPGAGGGGEPQPQDDRGASSPRRPVRGYAEAEAEPLADEDTTTDSEGRLNARQQHGAGGGVGQPQRKYSLQEGGVRDRPRRVSVAPAEGALPEGQLAALTAHHGDPAHHRWGPTQRRDSELPPSSASDEAFRNKYGRAPHKTYVQLAELVGEGDGDTESECGGESEEWKWEPVARWIKYEQAAEAGGARWGRPVVAALSHRALVDARRALADGFVLLDAPARDLPAVAHSLADGLGLAAGPRALLVRALLRPHRRVPEPGLLPDLSRRLSHYTSLQSLTEGRRRRSSVAPPPAERSEGRKRSTTSGPDGDEGRRESAVRGVGEGAEATAVLVATGGFVERARLVFVRFAEGAALGELAGAALPVRFVFLVLAPSAPAGPAVSFEPREVGRSLATLAANPTFGHAAARARSRSELLAALDDFLEESLVLPPGDWDRQELLPVEELRARSDAVRRRALARRRVDADSTAATPPALDEKAALLAAEAGVPPSKEPDDPLSRTGRLFGGVVRDMRRRYPHYLSDFRDALNGQCVAGAIFMYFAALSSAITFGGLLAEKTDRQIGISETLVFTMAGGVVFALVSGQPLMITGATGPLLLLDEALASACRSLGFHFLVARMYAGLWMVVIALVVAAAEGSVAVRKISRFTEDIFAFLISLIFISEPITGTIAVYRQHPLGADYTSGSLNSSVANSTLDSGPTPPLPQPNTALFCTMLTLATFTIAYYLRLFRNGKFLGRSARRALGDFGVPIAIATMVGVACGVPVWTETLHVPAGLSPTAARPWLVPLGPGLGSVPAWGALACLLPALMVYIIVFMETHIAELIVDKPERRLQKGSGFHMDIVVMSLVNAVCGLFGAPWQCVATVRSVSHVAALTVMSTTHAPGDKPHILHVKEQRVTGLLVSVLVGVSVVFGTALGRVPLAVLFGVFLYMGISALAGIQLWDRIVLLFKPVKHHPPLPYVTRVPTWKMHLYTLIQVCGLVVLYAVKSSRLSLALPFFLVMMVPLRMALVKLFTPLQLWALDGPGSAGAAPDDEPDFYEQAPMRGS